MNSAPQEYSYSRIRGGAAIPIRESGKVHPIQLYSLFPLFVFRNSLGCSFYTVTAGRRLGYEFQEPTWGGPDALLRALHSDRVSPQNLVYFTQNRECPASGRGALLL